MNTAARKQPTSQDAVPEDWRPHFLEHYKQHIEPHAAAFERDRQLKVKTIRKRATIAGVCGVIYGGLLILFHARLFDVVAAEACIFFGVFFGVAMTFWAGLPALHFSLDVKSTIFPKIVSYLGDFKFDTTVPFSARRFREWGIVPSFDKESNEDYIVGTYRGIGIELFESHLKDETKDSKGNTSTTTIFRGVFVNLAIPKPFKGKTVVLRDRGKFGNWLEKGASNLQSIKLEDPRFEKIFEVFGSDQIEARYLLTTAFMQRLLELHAWFGEGTSLECSFCNQSILIKLGTGKDLFEPGSVFKPVNFLADAEKFLNEIRLIFAIIHTLRLDSQTGL